MCGHQGYDFDTFSGLKTLPPHMSARQEKKIRPLNRSDFSEAALNHLGFQGYIPVYLMKRYELRRGRRVMIPWISKTIQAYEKFGL